jgi:hypothetical protein
VRAIIRPEELRSIGNYPPSPSSPAAKSVCARGHPKHGCSPIHDWTDEVPLRATEVAGTSDQNDSLVEAISFKSKPAFIPIAKIRFDFS